MSACFCSRCNINWASLWSKTGNDNVDEYEFCPECHSDMFLEEPNDIVMYIKCAFTGEIRNVDTGEIMTRPELPLPAYVPQKAPRRETQEEREARDLAAIDAYMKTESPDAFFSTYKNFKPIQPNSN